MAKNFSFTKEQRLKSRKLIDLVFSKGRRFNCGPFRVSFALEGKEGQLQFGITAGTRHFKKAVERNRIKRLARECWRLQSGPLKTFMSQQSKPLAVFAVYTGKELPGYDLVSANMGKIIDNLLRLLNEKSTSNP